MSKFIGRKQELNELGSLWNKASASLVVIRGRRRIGKSRLVDEFAQDTRYLKFSGLAPTAGVTAEKQRAHFVSQLARQIGLPNFSVDDWSELFLMLAREVESGKVVVLFDEISWMADDDPTFLSKLKDAWDNCFKNNAQLILVLCGSVSQWIEKNIVSSTGYFGRISHKIVLQELNVNESNQLLKSQHITLSDKDTFKLLSVTGGIPWYLEQIQSRTTADQNIQRLCFSPNGLLVDEYDEIFNDLFLRRSHVYKPIVERLAQGAATLNELCDALSYPKSGIFSEYLDDLIKAGFVTRHYTWSLKTGQSSRLSQYRLSDNYCRFYIKCIYPHLAQIENGQYRDMAISSLPGWESLIGLQFENLVLKNRALLWKALSIHPEEIIFDNPFFQRKTSRQKGVQIDYMIQTKSNMLYLFEFKCSKNPVPVSVLQEMDEKIKRLALPRGFACVKVLVTAGDVVESLYNHPDLFKLIQFDEFL